MRWNTRKEQKLPAIENVYIVNEELMNFLLFKRIKLSFIFLFFIIAFAASIGQDSLQIPISAVTDSLQISDSTSVADSSAFPDSTQQFIKPQRSRKNFDFQIVNSTNLNFYLAAPEGWKLDLESGKELGFAAVSYPNGWNLDYSPVLMCAKILNGKTSDGNSFKDVVSRQISQLADYGAEIIQDSIALTYDYKSSIVVHFLDKTTNVHNFISYINDKENIVSLTMTSKDQAKFEDAKPRFFDLINSYKSDSN